MTRDELLDMCAVMRKYGGQFMFHLAELLVIADEYRREVLLAAFPEVVDGYGPGSAAFNALHGGKHD